MRSRMLRLGTYDKQTRQEIILRGPVFTDSPEDLETMRRVIRVAYRTAGPRRHPRRAVGIFQVSRRVPDVARVLVGR